MVILAKEKADAAEETRANIWRMDVPERRGKRSQISGGLGVSFISQQAFVGK